MDKNNSMSKVKKKPFNKEKEAERLIGILTCEKLKSVKDAKGILKTLEGISGSGIGPIIVKENAAHCIVEEMSFLKRKPMPNAPLSVYKLKIWGANEIVARMSTLLRLAVLANSTPIKGIKTALKKLEEKVDLRDKDGLLELLLPSENSSEGLGNPQTLQ